MLSLHDKVAKFFDFTVEGLLRVKNNQPKTYQFMLASYGEAMRKQSESNKAKIAKIESDIVKTMDDWYYGNS